MNPTRATFLSGVILGVAIGLLAGHVTLWHPARALTHEDLGSPISFGTYRDLQHGFSTFERSASCPVDPCEEEPELPSPLANALALREVDDDPYFPTSGRTSQAPPGRLQPITEPQPLDIPDAEPLSDHNSRNEQFIRSMIESELGDVSEAQREVWFESLKDLRKEDVAGVLRMWKLFGGPARDGIRSNPVTPIPGAEFPPSTESSAVQVPPVHDRSSGADIGELVRQARAVHLRNLRMASQPGYVRMIPRFLESSGDDGPRIERITTEAMFHHRGTPVVTGNSLDCFIKGAGLFVVEDGQGRRYYTRNGRFSVGRDRRLVLRIGTDEFTVTPEMTLPSDRGSILISSSGEISTTLEDGTVTRLGILTLADVVGRTRLRYVANGLFEAGEDDPADVRLGRPEEQGLGSIESGQFEGSNVIPAAEWGELEQLQRLLKADETAYGQE